MKKITAQYPNTGGRIAPRFQTKMPVMLGLYLLTIGSLPAQRMITGQVMDEQNEPYCATVIADKGQFRNVTGLCSQDGSFSLFVPETQASVYLLGESAVEVPLSTHSDTLNIIYYLPLIHDVPAPKRTTASGRKQDTRVYGTVTNGNGEPLQAVVQVKGTDVRVPTDAHGRFSLQVSPGHDVLTFAGDQYDTREIHLGDQREVYVPMVLIRKPAR